MDTEQTNVNEVTTEGTTEETVETTVIGQTGSEAEAETQATEAEAQDPGPEADEAAAAEIRTETESPAPEASSEQADQTPAADEEAAADAQQPEAEASGASTEDAEQLKQPLAQGVSETVLKEKRAILHEAREALRASDYDPARIDEILARFDGMEDKETPAEQSLRREREEIAQRNEGKKKRLVEQAESAEKKKALIEKANALKGSEDWKKTTEAFKGLMDEWRATGNAGIEGDRLWEEFNAARQTFFDAQRRHYDELDSRNAERRAEKEKIIAEARAVTEEGGEDWKKIHERLEELFAQWKAVGAAGRDEERLWNAFQGIRHAFYERRTAARNEQDQIFRSRREDKEALIAQAEAYLNAGDYSAEATARMREMGGDWKDIGFCGRRQEDELWTKFHNVQNAYWQGRKAAGESRHEEWVEKTQAAIDRRQDRIERLKTNIENLKERLETAGEEKKAQISTWVAENEEQIKVLETEISRMKEEISK